MDSNVGLKIFISIENLGLGWVLVIILVMVCFFMIFNMYWCCKLNVNECMKILSYFFNEVFE